MSIDWRTYETDGFWDELITAKGRARKGAGNLCRVLAGLTEEELTSRRTAAELAIRSMGITFTVYTGEGSGSIDREWPFDIIPRLIMKKEWDTVSEGLAQRVKALNRFIDDVYHEQRIFDDDVLPREYIEKSKEFRRECLGINPPKASGPTSVAPIWYATQTVRCTSSKTISASRPASPTCSKTGRS